MTIKKEVIKTVVPETTVEKVKYTTSDGKVFHDFYLAEPHQKRLDAKPIVESLKQYGDWYFVSTEQEMNALWVIKSDGYLHYDARKEYVEFPSWVKLSIHKDYDNFWHEELETFCLHDMVKMMEPFGIFITDGRDEE